MKKIEGPREGFRRWWVGVVLRCEVCGSSYELEDGDEMHPWMLFSGDPGEVRVMCVSCDNILVKRNEGKK